MEPEDYDKAALIIDKAFRGLRSYSQRHTVARLSHLAPPLAKVCVDTIHNLFFGDKKGLLLVGPTGTGKTYAIIAMLREIMICTLAIPGQVPSMDVLDEESEAYAENPQAGIYIAECLGKSALMTHWDFVRTLRALAEDDIPNFYRTQLGKLVLVIDDLGRGYDDRGGWNQSLEDEFFDWRWREQLPLFLTNNIPLEGGRLKASDWGGRVRVIDRICDTSYTNIYVLNEKSRRTS